MHHALGLEEAATELEDGDARQAEREHHEKLSSIVRNIRVLAEQDEASLGIEPQDKDERQHGEHHEADALCPETHEVGLAGIRGGQQGIQRGNESANDAEACHVGRDAGEGRRGQLDGAQVPETQDRDDRQAQLEQVRRADRHGELGERAHFGPHVRRRIHRHRWRRSHGAVARCVAHAGYVGLKGCVACQERRFFAMLVQKLARKKARQIRACRARLFGHGAEHGVEQGGDVRRVECT